MALFTGNRDSQRRQSTAENEDRGQDAKLHEELSELSAEEHPRKVDRAKSEAEEAISDATLADIRGITLMERGRCPECGGRTESLLFTAVCAACGWFKRFVPEGGHCLVFLDTGDTIACDRVFEAEGDQILCIRDAVVRSQLARSAVRRIDYMWKDEELLKARERFFKEHSGVCGWCERSIDEAEEEDAPYEEFVAYGAYQERHLFCSKKCLTAFRRQYSVRIHRNCYERDCNECDECIKRYNTQGFKRTRL